MKDNLDKIIANIIDRARGAKLSNEEKSSIRFAISEKINSTSIPTPFWSFTFIRSYHYIPVALVLFVLVGSGAGIFAQNSLPGDALYSMKININEKMESFLAVTTRQAAEVDAIQATRRLDEAETLATKGELTDAKNKVIQDSFSNKVISLNTRFEKLDEAGETESAVAVLKKFDLEVKGKVNNLAKISTTTESQKSARDIVTFIEKKHNTKKEDSNQNEGVSNESLPVTTMMSTTLTSSLAESTTTATSTSKKMSKTQTTRQTSKSKNPKTGKIMWSWRSDK